MLCGRVAHSEMATYTRTCRTRRPALIFESIEYFTLPTTELPQGQWVLIRPMSPPTLLAGLRPFSDDLLFVGKRRLRDLTMFF